MEICSNLILAFKSKQLRELCEDNSKATKVIGDTAAGQLKHRIADIRAAENIHEVIVGNPRIFDKNNNNEYLIDLDENTRIRICANHNNNPVLESGEIDWERVSRVKIMEIDNNEI